MKNFKFIPSLLTFLIFPISLLESNQSARFEKERIDLLRKEIIARADKILFEPSQTITMSVCNRSAGSIHDFYSEGDYWWPDPANPDGPYIQRDGLTNPDIFVGHRKAMIRLSQIECVPADYADCRRSTNK